MHEKKNKILVVDSDAQVRKMLDIYLTNEGFLMEESDSGKQALRMSASIKPDLILLELSLPDMDGKHVISCIREWSQIPIVILSGELPDEEIISALDAGGDDCIVKPFNIAVLVAHIRANLRKAVVKEVGKPELINGTIRMDLLRHEVYSDGQKIALTPKEYEILRFFMVNRGRMLTHKQILNEIWGPAHGENTQYLRVYVGQVREKLEADPTNPQMIITEPCVGYRMEIMRPDLSAIA